VSRGRRRAVATTIAALGLTVVLVATGSGAVKVSKPIKAGYDPFDVAAGDFNRDGRTDLAVANFASSQENGSVASISILAGKKGGGYRKARTLLSGQPDGVEVARVGPGKEPDLVVSILSGDIEVYRGRKGFEFSHPKVSHVGAAPRDVATGDFNGDGRTDVAVTRQDDEDVLVLYAKKGKSGFGNGDSFPGVTTGSENLVSARINGDKRPDLLTANNQTGKLTVLLDKKGGGFTKQSYDVASAVAVAAGDFDGDGHADVAVAAAEPGSRPGRGIDAATPRVTIFAGSKTGALTQRKTLTLANLDGSFSPVLTAARLNSDRDPDLLLEVTTAGGGRPERGGGNHGAVVELEGKHDISFDPEQPVKVKGSPFHAGVIPGRRQSLAVPLLTDTGPGTIRIVTDR
jgi:hypothetical protein